METNPTVIVDEIVDQSSVSCKYLEIDQIENLSTNNYKYGVLQINTQPPYQNDQLKDIILSLSNNNIVIHFILLCETFE